MVRLEDKERSWNVAFVSWNKLSEDEKKSMIIKVDKKIVKWLKEYMVYEYGQQLPHITHELQKNDIFDSFVCLMALKIESKFFMYNQFLTEAKKVTEYITLQSQGDLLMSLFGANNNECSTQVTGKLETEIRWIENLLRQKYKNMKQTVYANVNHAISLGDFISRQSIVVFAIYSEKDYRERLIPKNPENPLTPVLVDPKRFVFFYGHLKRLVNMLLVGTLCGLHEFMDEVRAIYMYCN